MTLTIIGIRKNEIARICHEVNRAYCESIGDTSQLPWNEAAGWQRESAIAGVASVLADPSIGPGDCHRLWMQRKLDDGWSYGAVKDADTKTHPCLVDFDHLPESDKVKDSLFIGVVRVLEKMCEEVRILEEIFGMPDGYEEKKAMLMRAYSEEEPEVQS